MIFRAIFCLALLSAHAARADETGMETLADTVSYVVTCTQLTYDRDKILAYADRHHIDMYEDSADMARMKALSEAKVKALSKLPMTTVCTDAYNFYGPKGSKQAGLLWK